MAKSYEATERAWKLKAINDDHVTQVHKNVKHIPERMNARIEIRANRHHMHQVLLQCPFVSCLAVSNSI